MSSLIFCSNSGKDKLSSWAFKFTLSNKIKLFSCLFCVSNELSLVFKLDNRFFYKNEFISNTSQYQKKFISMIRRIVLWLGCIIVNNLKIQRSAATRQEHLPIFWKKWMSWKPRVFPKLIFFNFLFMIKKVLQTF